MATVEKQQVIGGRYRLLDRIGEGGMSVVWKAHDDVLLRPVAIKFLAAPYAADPAFRRSIRAEAQAAARLSHPNVAGVYDYGETDDQDARIPFVVMELLRGQSLTNRLSAGALPPELAMRICAEVAGALAAAHAHDLVHRDVKPGNIMLTASGAKVFDFGIAARVGDSNDADVARMVIGTPAYLAPERIHGAAVVPASDVYSLGVLLYRTVTGALPWSAATGDELMVAHLEADPAPLQPLAGLPVEVANLYEHCLAKRPEDRPSARQAATVLAAAAGIRPPVGDDDVVSVGSLPGTGERHTHALPTLMFAPTSRPGRATRARVAVALVAAASIVGLVAWAASMDDGAHLRGRGPVGSSASAPAAGGGPPPGGVNPTPAGVATSAVEIAVPPRADRSFSSPGGSVRATCNGDQAYLVSWSASPGYEIHDVDRGPSKDTKIVFRADREESRLTVSCKSGVPLAEIRNKS